MKSILVINVKGKNIENFIKKLKNNQIELYKINYLNRKEVNISINFYDYSKILKIKTIYEIKIINTEGLIKIKKVLKKNMVFIFMLVIGLITLIFLTNIIFKVEVIHNEEAVRNFIIDELKIYGIENRHFIKTFKQITNIKKQILSKHKNKIEWLEIERKGTKYQIRLELRKTSTAKENHTLYHIVSKKDAIIKKIEASSGEIVKQINNYVKTGDLIISGNINLNNILKGNVSAKGNIYGEVWYKVTAEYPLTYNEKRLTGKTKTTYAIKMLNKTITLFDFNPYKNKQTRVSNIFENLFIPIAFIKQKEEELLVIEEINTIDEAKDKAISLAYKKIAEKLTDKEYIINTQVLSTSIKESKIETIVFFTVYENITAYKKMEE
ncbi:MAG: sporulation protein YqfD [Bacilli bacterium]